MARSRRGGAGGIRGLLDELTAHGEAIEADLAHFYPGHSLTDLAAGRLTLRRLAVLLRNLPLDGTALWRAARREKQVASAKQVDPPPEWWSAERDLMAAVVDRLNVLIWQQTKDGHEGRNAPQPMHRPGAAPARPRDVNPAERKARLLKMAGRGSTAA